MLNIIDNIYQVSWLGGDCNTLYEYNQPLPSNQDAINHAVELETKGAKQVNVWLNTHLVYPVLED